MNDRRDHAARPEAGEDEVAALILLAGAPPTPSEDEVRSARDAARATWRRHLRARVARRRRVWVATAAATSLLVAAALTWRARERVPPPPAVAVASVELRTGEVTILPGAALDAGETVLAAGTVLDSAPDGRVAMRLAGGASVRVDGASRVRLASARSLELERGALYVDTGAVPGEPVEIVTPLGRVTDLGTQFEVRLSVGDETRLQQLRLRVREGEVRIDTESATHRAAAGSEIVLDGDGRPRRAVVAADDPGWHWATSVAPELEIEGQTLAGFLDRATRELGLRWRLVEPWPEQAPGEVVLRGSVAGLTPEEAIDVVLTGSGLRGERTGGELRISAAPEHPGSAEPR